MNMVNHGLEMIGNFTQHRPPVSPHDQNLAQIDLFKVTQCNRQSLPFFSLTGY